MQLFPCPFCGLRSEKEFQFGGDFGNLRPDGADISPERWSSYLHHRDNPQGVASEVWMHMTCGELFRLERDTVTHAVSSSHALSEGDYR